MSRFFWITVLTALVALSAVPVCAQKEAKDRNDLNCNDSWHGDRLASHCDIREQTIAASGGVLEVDARKNGGISIQGANRGDILVRARVQAAGLTQADADELAKQIQIQTSGSKIVADGPAMSNNQHWSVSYVVFVPRQTDLSLRTYNGGITIADVSGQIEFTALNGGVALKRIGGTVKGSTTNGGLSVELAGDRWDGETLDVSTTNGGIIVAVPENYSAHLETGTVNGNLSVEFPVTVQGRITRELAVNLGSGGATIRAMTTNGGVKIRRLGSTSNE